MSTATADVRIGVVRERRGVRSVVHGIGIAYGTQPPPTVIFEHKNQRRLQLIEKEFAGELSTGEEAELERLQRETAGIMGYLYPLSTTMLDELEALATHLESHSGTDKP